MSDIPTAAAVVPGTELLLFQDSSGEVFCRKDQAHVGQPAKPKRLTAQQSADRGEDGGAAVDGEHPDRGVSSECHITATEGIQSGEQDFHAPAGQTAFYKIVKKGKQGSFHSSSHSAASGGLKFCGKQREY